MKRFSTLLSIILIGWFSVGYAEDYEVADFGERMPTSRELVEALLPPPQPKVRGIILHSNTQARSLSQGQPNLSQSTWQGLPQEKPKAVSMQVHFNFDSADLTPDSQAKLNVVASALNAAELAHYKFRIEGHTDSIGSETYNLRLSQRRAQSVAQYLRQNYRIQSGRLETIGKGMNEPANPADPRAPENRRVVIVNVGSL
ncbi:MAG: OmpA family protein [Candidatus Competibacteraceae bacterium]|nr:OmpA family protein [Candidatus Competibacteraceae bacterium]